MEILAYKCGYTAAVPSVHDVYIACDVNMVEHNTGFFKDWRNGEIESELDR